MTAAAARTTAAAATAATEDRRTPPRDSQNLGQVQGNRRPTRASGDRQALAPAATATALGPVRPRHPHPP
eukprot:7939260-Pyramimonas_sp.AAC.1